ncbi:YDL036Cp-like protein, related [Neospora caninum Liverpool]|uniref:YDL036Cp-like protein, related n=1 Tax=Neospora caninum (strain Liverpool) TaxID=572307 RepID=F0VEU8_NEOCL|nr:YDL036Cp-like protein, related [Neospora caninum Liverpool]CBZ52242.1 YDL036Cp-like protein, related [Neospora caninum Liverpool]|eukprot:XP_003882274.1 YDL036Cp-like protein, related [Neospora caninum Liverpool]
MTEKAANTSYIRADDAGRRETACRDGSVEAFRASAPGVNRKEHPAETLAPPDSLEPGGTVEVLGNASDLASNAATVMHAVEMSPVGGRRGERVPKTRGWSRPTVRIRSLEQNEAAGVSNHVDRSSLTLLPDEKHLDVLYEDDDIVVINKPAGLLTHPPQLTVGNGAFPETFLPLAKQAAFRGLTREACSVASRQTKAPPPPFQESSRDARDEEPVEVPTDPAADSIGGPSSMRVSSVQLALPEEISRPASIVHRLDIGTSGALVAAKTIAAAENLKYQWAERKVLKGYIGLCAPEIHKLQEVDAAIRRHPVQRGRMEALINDSRSGFHETVCDEKVAQNCQSNSRLGAKPGVSVFAPLGGNGVYGMFAALALTGRTHQIRAHLEYIGHPLLGDPVYGNQTVNEQFRSAHWDCIVWRDEDEPINVTFPQVV